MVQPTEHAACPSTKRLGSGHGFSAREAARRLGARDCQRVRPSAPSRETEVNRHFVTIAGASWIARAGVSPRQDAAARSPGGKDRAMRRRRAAARLLARSPGVRAAWTIARPNFGGRFLAFIDGVVTKSAVEPPVNLSLEAWEARFRVRSVADLVGVAGRLGGPRGFRRGAGGEVCELLRRLRNYWPDSCTGCCRGRSPR